MLRIMANTMMIATGWERGPDFGQDHGPAFRPLVRDAAPSPEAAKAERLRRARLESERAAPTESLAKGAV